MNNIKAQYDRGVNLHKEGRLDAAWCVFLKTLHLLELSSLQKADIEIHKFRFFVLCEIGKIQQEKNKLEAVDATFIKAESIRSEFLAETGVEPVEHVGLLKWQNDYDTLVEMAEQNLHYAVLAMAKSTAEEIEELEDCQITRNHRRLLMKIYDIISRSYEGIEEPEKAAEYDDKVEDIAFIYGFDRFS